MSEKHAELKWETVPKEKVAEAYRLFGPKPDDDHNTATLKRLYAEGVIHGSIVPESESAKHTWKKICGETC